MECKLITGQDEESVKKLWAYCFEREDHPFFKSYFSHVYNPQNILGVYEKKMLLGCLHLNPYQIYLRGRVWPISYVVGVGTYPAARNQGVAKKMLNQAFHEMRQRGHFISLLMPFSAAFYYPYDFSLCYKYFKYEIPIIDLKKILHKWGVFHEVQENNTAELSCVYDQFTAGKHGYVLRDKSAWRQWISAHRAEQGNLYYLEKDGQPQGYIAYYLLEDKIFVKEMAYTCFAAQKAILALIYSHYSQVDKLVWQSPEDDQMFYFLPNPHKSMKLIPHMMGRIIDVAEVLAKTCVPYEELNGLCLKVLDRYADWNHQTFKIEVAQNEVKVTPLGEHPYDICCSVGALTQLIFGARTASELAFTGELTGNKDIIQMLTTFFPKCCNYFNEEF